MKLERTVDQTGEPSTRIHYVMAVTGALVSSGKPVSPLQVYNWLKTNGLRRARNALSVIEADQRFHKEARFARQELADGGLVRSVDGRGAVERIDGLQSLTPDPAREMIRRDRNDRRASGEPVRPASIPRHTDPDPGRQNGPWSRRTDGPASTYAFRFGDTDLWKIGFAARVAARLQEVNRHVPVELGGSVWAKFLTARWPSQLAAYSMEQDVLRRQWARCAPERQSDMEIGTHCDSRSATMIAIWCTTMTGGRRLHRHPHGFTYAHHSVGLCSLRGREPRTRSSSCRSHCGRTSARTTSASKHRCCSVVPQTRPDD